MLKATTSPEAHGSRRISTPHSWIASSVLILFGLVTVGTGVYFMAFRPALLAEDLRFTGLSQAEVPAALLPWLRIVFRTWGGFIVGLGLCVLGCGASYRSRTSWSGLATAFGLLFSFGSFFVSNVQLSSNFLWFITLLFIGAIASAAVVLRGLEGRP